ncbi:MAG TPA: hypothetical protein VMB85_15860 [Bryobacteraceae bacterium]|nr:hypothetical protein [Bryobacteraceae bacterium]
MRNILVGVGVLALAVASAQGRHPHYLKARSDLRAAQLMLHVDDEPKVMLRLHEVDAEIGRAIGEIDRAAVIDRKDIIDHPPVDTRLDRPGRLRKAMALLASARRDLAAEEENRRAMAWRDAAYRHIDVAMDLVRRAAREWRIDHLEGH